MPFPAAPVDRRMAFGGVERGRFCVEGFVPIPEKLGIGFSQIIKAAGLSVAAVGAVVFSARTCEVIGVGVPLQAAYRTLQRDVLSRGAAQLIRRYGVAAQLVELEKLLLLMPDTPVLKRDFCFHRMSSFVTDFLTIKLYRIAGNLSKPGRTAFFTVWVCCGFRPPLFWLLNDFIRNF